MKIDFEKQTILVTGATRGIGKQIAEDFHELGAQLILTGTNPEQIKRLNLVSQEQEARKQYYCVDFSDTKSTDLFFKNMEKYNQIDVCINNAGINRIETIDKVAVKDFDDILDINLRAPFLIVSKVSKIMKKNQYGRIVNISSIFSVISKQKRSMYSTSKSGMNGLTRSSANDLAQYNILVNSVSPGFVQTDLTRKILSDGEIAELSSQVPIGRFATPTEISKVVLFLSSRMNTYLTGQNIIVDGGFVNV